MPRRFFSSFRNCAAWLFAALLALVAVGLLAGVLLRGADRVFLLVVAALAWWSLALARRATLAMRLAAAACLLCAIVLPLGAINPFAAGDLMAGGHEPPAVSGIFVWLLPLETLLIAMAYVLDLRTDKASGEHA